jgi:hypothetical protein
MRGGFSTWKKSEGHSTTSRSNLEQALIRSWTIFPPDFNVDPLLAMGKLQAWTLKSAVG